MRPLQLLTMALLAMSANADYQMVLCGNGFGPCQVTPTATVPTAADTALVDAKLMSTFWNGADGYMGGVFLTGKTEAGFIGTVSLCCSDTAWTYFTPDGWPHEMFSLISAYLFDMNDSGVIVGSNPAGYRPFVLGMDVPTVLPDPRLGLPQGDMVTPEYGAFTAIDDLGQIHGWGTFVDSFGKEISGGQYDLLIPSTSAVPEPSSLLLLLAPLAILRRRRNIERC